MQIPLSDNICLKITGGLGDTIIAVGGSARALSKEGRTITAAVRPFQLEFIKKLQGVDKSIDVCDLNDAGTAKRYKIIDFTGTFNTRRFIRKGDYYSLVEKKIGMKVDLPILNIESGKKNRVVCLHTSASNPNRRWEKEKWEELAYCISDNGYEVFWLGTSDEFGFNDKNNSISKLSDISNDLIFQSDILSNSCYFVGNDSGFAHVAGIQGVSGAVLFFNTHPDDVTSRYPTLIGIHCFEHYDSPTRSLKKNCEVSKKYSKLLTVEKVVAECGFELKFPSLRVKENPQRLKLYIFTKNRGAFQYLEERFDVEYINHLRNGELTLVDADFLTLRIQGKKFKLSAYGENLIRAIREIICSLETVNGLDFDS